MSYQKQHFVPEQFLSAAELNHIEEGIELNRTLARNFEAAHIETLFKNSEVEPDRIIGGNTSGWSEVQSAPSANEHTYLILRISSNNNWSKPIKISSKSYSGGGSGTPDGGDGSVEGGGSSGDIWNYIRMSKKFVGLCRFVSKKNRPAVKKYKKLRSSIFQRLDNILK